MSIILCYTTHNDEEQAKTMIQALLEKKLIACANITPIKSMYLWQGRKEETSEIAIIMKTTPDNWEQLRAAIEQLHPYEVPCIIKLPVEANEQYEEWIRKETRP